MTFYVLKTLTCNKINKINHVDNFMAILLVYFLKLLSDNIGSK